MWITCKRAHLYEDAALKAATATKYQSTVALSIYAPELADPSSTVGAGTMVAAAREKLMAQHQMALDLIAACYAIRQLVAAVNTRAEISPLVTRRAQAEAEEARLRALLAACDHGFDHAGTEASLPVAMAKARALRDQPSDRFGGRNDTVTVVLLDAADIERYQRQLMLIKSRRAAINDELTALNINNSVLLDAATVRTLQRAGLIVTEPTAL